MTADATGVVLMAYGTPRTREEIGDYYTHIRRGNPPPPDLLADLEARYAAIGGLSPLAERSAAQRAALQTALDERAPGRYQVVLGHKHAVPFIEDAVDELADGGVTRAVGLVLAPHYSRFSVGAYLDRAAEAASTRGLALVGIDAWHTEPAYLDFLAGALRETLTGLPDRTKVLFTAHSLPERALVDDPYPDQLRESAEAVAEKVGLSAWSDWALAWQSAGRTEEAWRGPDVLSVIRDLGDTGPSEGVAVCAQGFVSDHLEVLYDLDIEARRAAEAAGLAFGRTASLNDDHAVMSSLADRVIRADEAPEP